MLIESSEVDRVVLRCESADCDGREAEHESETVAYWENLDAGNLVTRRICGGCGLSTTIRRWVGPGRAQSHECSYSTDTAGS
ncbi:hypothetical protein OG809_35120 [Kribbella soli]